MEVFLDENILKQPLHWKKPRRIFVESQSDIFAEFVTDEMIRRMYLVMASCQQHTFQVLTKRKPRPDYTFGIGGVLPNVWLGISCEDQQRADERIPLLLQVPAAVRFISAEPLLGPVDLTAYLDRLDWVIVGGES